MESPKTKEKMAPGVELSRAETDPSRFPKTARLLKPTEFKKVFENSAQSSDPYFRVLGRFNEVGVSRLGMAVSRKVDKRSVGRNRIKRVVRESFRHARGALGSQGAKKEGIDLVVLPRQHCATISNKQLFQSLEAHWARIDSALQRKKTIAEQQATTPGNTRAAPSAGTKLKWEI